MKKNLIRDILKFLYEITVSFQNFNSKVLEVVHLLRNVSGKFLKLHIEIFYSHSKFYLQGKGDKSGYFLRYVISQGKWT